MPRRRPAGGSRRSCKRHPIKQLAWRQGNGRAFEKRDGMPGAIAGIATRASNTGEEQQMENTNQSDRTEQQAMPDAKCGCSRSSFEGFAVEQAALQCGPSLSGAALDSFAILNPGTCLQPQRSGETEVTA